MLKKILVSIAFSISMLNYSAYGEVINSENNMYKQYFNNGKINQKKILNELASEDIRFSGSGLKDFLLDKNNNISIEEAKQIIDSLRNNVNSFENKLFFYFRYYQYLDDNLIKEIKNRFKEKNTLSDSYIETIIDFYSFIPEKDRKELIYNLIDNCNYCNKISDLLSKDYNKELLEHYVYKVAPKSEHDTYKPQDIIVVLYDKLDGKLKEKLFDDIKGRIAKKEIWSIPKK